MSAEAEMISVNWTFLSTQLGLWTSARVESGAGRVVFGWAFWAGWGRLKAKGAWSTWQRQKPSGVLGPMPTLHGCEPHSLVKDYYRPENSMGQAGSSR
jgi:hypothetical protein